MAVSGMGKLRQGGIVLPAQVFSGAVGAEPRAKRVQNPPATMESRGQAPSWGNVGYPQQVSDDLEGQFLAE